MKTRFACLCWRCRLSRLQAFEASQSLLSCVVSGRDCNLKPLLKLCPEMLPFFPGVRACAWVCVLNLYVENIAMLRWCYKSWICATWSTHAVVRISLLLANIRLHPIVLLPECPGCELCRVCCVWLRMHKVCLLFHFAGITFRRF